MKAMRIFGVVIGTPNPEKIFYGENDYRNRIKNGEFFGIGIMNRRYGFEDNRCNIEYDKGN
jgi:hypothetical protein